MADSGGVAAEDVTKHVYQQPGRVIKNPGDMEKWTRSQVNKITSKPIILSFLCSNTGL